MKGPFIYVVHGHWPFPTDMLRHDQSTGKSIMDADMVTDLSSEHAADDSAFEPIDITLQGPNMPNVARWNTFGWAVVAICDKGGNKVEVYPSLADQKVSKKIKGTLRYSVEQQADGTHAIFCNGGFVRGGFPREQRTSALHFARELASQDEEVGVSARPPIDFDERSREIMSDRRPDTTISIAPSWSHIMEVCIAAFDEGTDKMKEAARAQLRLLGANLDDAHFGKE